MSRSDLILDLDLASSSPSDDACLNNDRVAAKATPINFMEKLPGLLRLFGAAAVLFSLYSFLFRGWEGSDDLLRYGMLLGHTLLLVVIALGSGKIFREGKSPRLLMMLSLVSVPVNFAILGAFIFAGYNSVFAVDYPTYVAWSVGSLNTAIALALAACAVLIPVILLAFRTLVRGMSINMSALFVVANLVLLIPARDPITIFVLASALAIVTLFISAKTAHQRTEVKTFEGMIALMLQFLPLAILLGRSAWLYAADMLLFVGIAGTLFIILRHISVYLNERLTTSQVSNSRILALLNLVSLVLAQISGLALSCFLFEANINDSIALVAGALTAAAMSYEISIRAIKKPCFYRCVAILVLTLPTLLNLIFVGGVVASLTTLALGLACAVYSYHVQQRLLLIAGSIMVLAGMIDQLINTMSYFDFNYWLAMAAVGIVAIVLASLLESKGQQMKILAKKYHADYRRWSI